MAVDEKTRSFIQHRLDNKEVPTQIIDALVSGGWDQQQATLAVQEVSGVQLAQATGPGGYTKPPIILRILYVLSFFVLILGIVMGVFAVIAFSQVSSAGDWGGFAFAIAMINGVLSLVYIISFFLVRDMKKGSLKALKVLTGFIALNVILSLLFSYFQARDSLFGEVDYATLFGQAIGSNLIQVLIFTYIWKKHRAYFH